MVDWKDPAILLKDYTILVKLNHAMAGLYIWETLLTAGFELDVLRRKRPYRWTIWLYLGTRCTGLLGFICLFIVMDGTGIPCHSFTIAFFTLGYSSWAFASLIIILRVIAIWDRNMVVSLIAVGTWLGGLALNIRRLIILDGRYSPVTDTCIFLHTHRGITNAFGVLVVDAVLLLTMLIGLLRPTHRNSAGIWKLLYQQCIIWFALALIAEIPVVVCEVLDLNDAWNDMFIGVALTILSIAAARMYRSLFDPGLVTGSMSSHPPRFSLGASNPIVLRGGSKGHGPMHIVSVTQSEGTQMTHNATAVSQTDEIELEFIPGGSISSLAHKNTREKTHPAVYEVV